MTETIDHQIKNEPTKENPKQFPKSTKIKAKILLALGLFGFVSGITGCDAFVEHMAQDDFFTGPKDNSPAVLEGQRIFAEQQAEQSSTLETLVPHDSFEVPAANQRILPGSRVEVVATGGDGLNIRTEAGINSNLVKNVPDGTVFKVIELAGEKDGYYWILVKSESDESIGYVATDWLQVLKDGPVQ